MRETITDMLDREPFQPFVVVLTSDDRYEVHNPDLAVLLQTQLFVAQPQSDRYSLLRLNQIAAVETLKPAA